MSFLYVVLNHSPQDLLGYYLNKKTNCNFSFRRCRGHKGVEFFGFDSSSSCWKRTSISILYDVLAVHHHKFDYRKTIQTSRTILQKIKVDHESTQFRNRKTRDHNPHLIFAFAVQILLSPLTRSLMLRVKDNYQITVEVLWSPLEKKNSPPQWSSFFACQFSMRLELGTKKWAKPCSW